MLFRPLPDIETKPSTDKSVTTIPEPSENVEYWNTMPVHDQCATKYIHIIKDNKDSDYVYYQHIKF